MIFLVLLPIGGKVVKFQGVVAEFGIKLEVLQWEGCRGLYL